MRVFTCPGCDTDAHLSYNTKDDMLQCSSCRIKITRKDALARELLWITSDKRVIPVKQMETSHIRNCIGKIFVSGGSWRGRMLAPLVEELEIRERTNKSG